jgi:hypothetical protein
MRALAFCTALVLAGAAAADAKSATARRFDVGARVDPGGTLHVTETIVFSFDGTFEQVTREIPARRTDGVDVHDARMDGRHLPFGVGPGQVEVSGQSTRRIRWRFAPLRDSTHTFQVTYSIRGAIRQEPGADVLSLRVPGGDHAWMIERASLSIDLPAGTAPPDLAVDTRRARLAARDTAPGRVRIAAGDVRSNGWLEATLRLPAATLVASPPAWQVRQRRANDLAVTWATAGAGILAIGLIGLFALRQGYDAPPRDVQPGTAGPVLPDNLPAALAGAIVRNGSASLEQAMATLFDLAQRGEIAVEPQRGTLGTRAFVLSRTPRMPIVDPLEQEALAMVFRDGEATVSLSTARSRAVRRLGRFKKAVAEALAAAGLVDADRGAVRGRVLRASLLLMIVGLVAVAPAAMLTGRFSGWPMLVPAAFEVLALAGAILHGTMTPLSNDAVRRASRWRALRHELAARARQQGAGMPADPHLLPYAIALGLASHWSKQAKHERADAPGWFRGTDDAEAFPAFVASAGAGQQQHGH